MPYENTEFTFEGKANGCILEVDDVHNIKEFPVTVDDDTIIKINKWNMMEHCKIISDTILYVSFGKVEYDSKNLYTARDFKDKKTWVNIVSSTQNKTYKIYCLNVNTLRILSGMGECAWDIKKVCGEAEDAYNDAHNDKK